MGVTVAAMISGIAIGIGVSAMALVIISTLLEEREKEDRKR